MSPAEDRKVKREEQRKENPESSEIYDRNKINYIQTKRSNEVIVWVVGLIIHGS